jgi:hypothetical protein
LNCPGRCDAKVHYVVDDEFNDDEQEVIAEAAAAWERGSGGRVCFSRTSAKETADLQFIRLAQQSDLEPQDPEWRHHVALCKGSKIWIVPSKIDERGEYVALVIHEIGHHLGLPHIEDAKDTYMHSTINDTPRELWTTPQIPERDRHEYCAVRSCFCAW